MSTLATVAKALPFVGSKGFEFRETMSGHHVLLEGKRKGEKLSFAFDCRAFTDSLADFLDPAGDSRMTLKLTGELRAEGLASRTPLEGFMEWHFLSKEGMLVYDFDFTGDDGRRYNFHGEKNREVPNVTKGMTTLYGTVINKSTGEKVSQGITYFDMKDLKPFLQSYKLI